MKITVIMSSLCLLCAVNTIQAEPQTAIIDQSSRANIDKLGEEFTAQFLTLPRNFTEKTGATASVFIRNGDTFLRVTTSVTKKDRSFALGTLLDKTHPGYQLLIDGKIYLGKATIFQKNYITKYTPIKDQSGKTIVILSVGVVEK